MITHTFQFAKENRQFALQNNPSRDVLKGKFYSAICFKW